MLRNPNLTRQVDYWLACAWHNGSGERSGTAKAQLRGRSVSKKTTYPATPKTRSSAHEPDAGAARPSQASEWLNHATGGPKTTDIFQKTPSRKRRMLRAVGVGAFRAGRGSLRLGRRAGHRPDSDGGIYDFREAHRHRAFASGMPLAYG